MTDQELIAKLDGIRSLTKDIAEEERNDIIESFMSSILEIYLSDKSEIRREIYDLMEDYIYVDPLEHSAITFGNIVWDKSREKKEEIEEEKRRIEERFGLWVDGEFIDICWSIARCREYIPKEVRKTRIFNNFELAWEEKVYSGYPTDEHKMEMDDFCELEKRYGRCLGSIMEASRKFFENEGYYELKRKLNEVLKEYNELSEVERDKVIAIEKREGSTGNLLEGLIIDTRYIDIIE